MDLGAMASELKNEAVNSSVNMKMVAKSQEIAETQANQLLQAIPSPPGLGGQVDIQA
jgi:hypothetical protein